MAELSTSEQDDALDHGEGSLASPRLIEQGFPCHQVGAETQRERGASSALPPLYFLHVWWARRPLTPSRAAILASALPHHSEPDEFLRSLGLRRWQAVIDGVRWNIVDPTLLSRIERHGTSHVLPVDKRVQRAFVDEQERRENVRAMLDELRSASADLAGSPVLELWHSDVCPLPRENLVSGTPVEVIEVSADPAGVQERFEFAKMEEVQEILGQSIRLHPEDSYGYSRAYTTEVEPVPKDESLVVLDPTSGGGSIPFEAMRLGHEVIANELNPVASVILKATLDFPARFGTSLLDDLEIWGQQLCRRVAGAMAPFTPFSRIPDDERAALKDAVNAEPELAEIFAQEYDHTGLLFCRQVTCPNCGGEAPLLNSSWLSKSGEKWGVTIEPQKDRTVRFRPYRIERGNRGPEGEDPELQTVKRGVGVCVHCRQGIDGDEIKRQARGESDHGRWKDVLYTVVAVRLQPKLDRNGAIQRYKTGARAGEVKVEKVRYFRAPNAEDLDALAAAEAELDRRRIDFEMQGLVPNDPFPEGNDMRPVTYGMPTWADLFTPRQLLGHLTAAETLTDLKPQILEALGEERSRAVVTYLQFAIDKCVDYNSSSLSETKGTARALAA